MTAAAIRISPVADGDKDTVADLFVAYRQFYDRYGDEDAARAFMHTRLARADSLVWVALADDDPVGFTQVYPSHSSLSLVTDWVLNDLYVAPQGRGMGAGRRLVEHVLAQARHAGVAQVRLETHPENTTARTLYESAGFTALPKAPEAEFIDYIYDVTARP